MQSAVLEEQRNALRRAVLQRRSALAPATRLALSRSIQKKVLELPQYLAADSIALYCAMGNEVDTGTVLSHALAHKKVFCPKMSSDRGPFFAQIFCASDLVAAGPKGTVEPRGDVGLAGAACEGAIIIVPGVVFDRSGNRLGRGGGWYDRALAWLDRRGIFVGLAYEFQLVDAVPAEPWDRRVHYVITESRVIDCGVMPQAEVAR